MRFSPYRRTDGHILVAIIRDEFVSVFILYERSKNMRKKLLYKTNYCKGCIWLKSGSFCPFKRCVKGFGWVADKNGKEGGKNE